MSGSASSDATAPGPRSSPGRGSRRLGLVAGTAVVVFGLDQLTKWWALNTLTNQTIAVVWTLQLNLARNTGAAFSVGRGTDWGRFIPLLALIVVGVVIWQGPRTVSTRFGAVAVGMIVGGALGNLADRAFRTGAGGFFSGAVVDFIDLQWWPIFNVADMGVVVGGLLLVAVSFRAPSDEVAADPDADTAEPGTGDAGGAAPSSP